MTIDSFSDAFGGLIEIGGAPVRIVSTSPRATDDFEVTRSALRRASELALIVGLFLQVGTGGFAKAPAAKSTPSSSSIWVSTRTSVVQPQASTSYVPVHDGDDLSAQGRIEEIRNRLSLNLKQLADAMNVGRPAVYGWLQGATPREAQQIRLKDLFDVSQEWAGLCHAPIGKFLISPHTDGISLLQLLKEPELDRPRITVAMRLISSTIHAAERRRAVSQYRSAASVMRDRGISPASREIQTQRVEDAAELS